jgi:hypothetical protein
MKLRPGMYLTSILPSGASCTYCCVCPGSGLDSGVVLSARCFLAPFRVHALAVPQPHQPPPPRNLHLCRHDKPRIDAADTDRPHLDEHARGHTKAVPLCAVNPSGSAPPHTLAIIVCGAPLVVRSMRPLCVRAKSLLYEFLERFKQR